LLHLRHELEALLLELQFHLRGARLRIEPSTNVEDVDHLLGRAYLSTNSRGTIRPVSASRSSFNSALTSRWFATASITRIRLVETSGKTFALG